MIIKDILRCHVHVSRSVYRSTNPMLILPVLITGGGGVNIGGRRIKCIILADDMALLAEDERMLKDVQMELNDRCEAYGMKININKTKDIVIGKNPKKIDIRVKDESVEEVNSVK